MATENLKGRNVNIRWFFITIFIGVNFCFSQISKTIEGSYVLDNVPDWVGEAGVYTYFEFKNNGTFKKEVIGELGKEQYADGEYKFIDNLLILDYNKTVPLKMSYHVSEIWESNKDSITVDFNLFDFDGNPATKVNIMYLDSLSQRGYKVEVSDENGRASFKLKRDITELEFDISSWDYGLTTSILHAFYYITIYKEWNYKISVYLQKSETGIPILNKTDILDIVKMRRKYFVVKNKNGSEMVWRKIDEEIED